MNILPIIIAAQASAMSNIVQGVTDIVTASITWLTSTVTAVMATGNELLLFFVLSSFVGIGIGLLMRFVHR